MEKRGEAMNKFKIRRDKKGTRAGLSVLGSILSAVMASACCIGPALLALVGAGTAGLSGILGMYRPYFIGLSVVLLGVAFYHTYRKREVKCEDGTSKRVNAGRWDRVSVWFAAVVTIAVIVVPSISAAHTATAESLKVDHAEYKLEAASHVRSVGDSCCEVRKEPK